MGVVGQIHNYSNGRLIADYAITHQDLLYNTIYNRGTKMLSQRVKILEKELLDRELMTQDDINYVNK